MAIKILGFSPNLNRPVTVEGPGLGGTILVLKTNDTSRDTTTVSVADPQLLIPLAVGERWIGEMCIFYTGEADGDLKTHLEIPVGASGRWGVHGLAIAALTFSGDLSAESITAFTSGTPISVGGPELAANAVLKIPFVVTVGTTPGNLTLFWAQRVSDGDATTIFANSYIIAHRL